MEINQLDKLNKERQFKPKGELNPWATLTDDKVRKIRELNATGMIKRLIALNVGCSRLQASKVANMETWTHVK